jgi:hypothetical protein
MTTAEMQEATKWTQGWSKVIEALEADRLAAAKFAVEQEAQWQKERAELDELKARIAADKAHDDQFDAQLKARSV